MNQKRARSVLRAGVTMVEVMVVVVLVGILSAIAIPRFLATSGLSQLDADANRLKILLQEARTKAVASGVMHFVKINPSKGAFTLFRDDLDNVPDSGDVRVRTDTLGVSVRFGFGSNWTSLPGSSPVGTTGFSSTSVPSSGFSPGVAANSGTECAADPNAAGSWADSVVAFCPGVLGDVETGALYLSTTRSRARAYAILYNDAGAQAGLQIRRYTWMGSSWTLQ